MSSSPIHSDPDILGGTMVFRDTRVPFQALIDYLEGGESLDEFLEDFPTVTREQAIRAIRLVEGLSPSTNMGRPESPPRG